MLHFSSSLSQTSLRIDSNPHLQLPVISLIQNSLHTTPTLINATISSFSLAQGIAPLFWGSFSDVLGRRKMYLIAISIYIAATLGCLGLGTRGVEYLIAFRFLQVRKKENYG